MYFKMFGSVCELVILGEKWTEILKSEEQLSCADEQLLLNLRQKHRVYKQTCMNHEVFCLNSLRAADWKCV